MSKFEMCHPQLFLFWLLSRKNGVRFTEAQPGSISTALCFEIAYLLLRKIFKSSKQIRRELKIQMFPHQNYEPLEIKCNFQRPSSSESSLTSSGFKILYLFAIEFFIMFGDFLQRLR